MDEESYYLSYGNGSKSETDVWIDQTGVVENDGRSVTRTGFNIERGDGHGNVISPRFVHRDGELIRHWEWLNQLNDGKHSNDNNTRKRRANLRRDARTWCSQLECTSHQTGEVCYYIDQLDSLKKGVKAEAVVFALISLVANEDGYWVQRVQPDDSKRPSEFEVRYGPSVVIEFNGDCEEIALFTRMMADVGVDPSHVRLLRKEYRGMVKGDS